MAIRPVDLQLSYMAAPQNAAVLGNAQDAPQTAQQAAQAAFAAALAERQEHIDSPVEVDGAKLGARDDSPRDRAQSRGRRRDASADEEAGDGEHFIDTTA